MSKPEVVECRLKSAMGTAYNQMQSKVKLSSSRWCGSPIEYAKARKYRSQERSPVSQLLLPLYARADCSPTSSR